MWVLRFGLFTSSFDLISSDKTSLKTQIRAVYKNTYVSLMSLAYLKIGEGRGNCMECFTRYKTKSWRFHALFQVIVVPRVGTLTCTSLSCNQFSVVSSVLLDFLLTDFLPFKSIIFRTWENLETNVKHLFPITQFSCLHLGSKVFP